MSSTSQSGRQVRSLVGTSLTALCVVASLSSIATAEDVDFNRDILPILSDKCFACHGPDEATREGDLRLDVEAEVFASRDEPAIVRGNPEQSVLIQRILSTGDDQMPPQDVKKQLSTKENAMLSLMNSLGMEMTGFGDSTGELGLTMPTTVDAGL